LWFVVHRDVRSRFPAGILPQSLFLRKLKNLNFQNRLIYFVNTNSGDTLPDALLLRALPFSRPFTGLLPAFYRRAWCLRQEPLNPLHAPFLGLSRPFPFFRPFPGLFPEVLHAVQIPKNLG
jgi:hypothetical protein